MINDIFRLLDFIKDLISFNKKEIFVYLVWRDEHGGILRAEKRKMGHLSGPGGFIAVEMDRAPVE